MSRDVLLGVVIGAQGLKGEVRVKTFTETPRTLGAYGVLHAKDGRAFTVETLRAHRPDEAVARFREIADRAAAENLKGTELFVSRDTFPAPDAEEFYHDDLVGLRAEDTEGRSIGTVRAIHDFGAGTVIEIVRSDGDDMFLPFTHDVAREIDLIGGRIVIAEPQDIEADERGNVE